jgi:putative endonuclease
MYYVYMLQSVRYRNKLYVGFTADLRKRLRAHSAGNTYTTRRLRPLDLVYYEAYKSKADAKRREKQLKSYGAALGHLKKRISDSLCWRLDESAGSETLLQIL